jgi:hypothetical protein
MHGVTPSAPIIPRCECGSPVELAATERLDDRWELRIYTCSACKRMISHKAESAEIGCASEDGSARPATGERKARARPKRNKLFYKNRWLISQHLVIALRRAGVVCDIVVADRDGNIASLPTGHLSPRQRRDLALRCSSSDLDADLIEADPELDIGFLPFKFYH